MELVDLPRAETWSIANLVRDATRGLLRVPPFQWNLRWDADDVAMLFATMTWARLAGFNVPETLLRLPPEDAMLEDDVPRTSLLVRRFDRSEDGPIHPRSTRHACGTIGRRRCRSFGGSAARPHPEHRSATPIIRP